MIFAQSIIGGGDHDYVPHGEPLIGGGDHDKIPHGPGPLIGGGDHDLIPHGPGPIIGGGDHDLIPHGPGPLIGGGDHDYVPHESSDMIFLSEEPIMDGGMDGGLHDYIFRLSRQELTNMAFAAERYGQEMRGGMPILGGLHDYINGMSDAEIAQYVLDQAKKYPELNSYDRLRDLQIQYGIIHGETGEMPTFGDATMKMGGLVDFLWREPRENLEAFALSTEKYHRDINGQHLYGGLHDRIASMSVLDLASYILKEAREHPEIDDYNKLKSLSMEYGFIKNETAVVLLEEEPMKVGGLSDFLWREPRKNLEAFALSTEKYHRTVKNLHLMGGLHDYINTMSNLDLADYILRETREHPEIDDYNQLKTLATKYGFADSFEVAFLEVEGVNAMTTVADYLPSADRATLIRWALTCERHERVSKGIKVLGGLEDYVDSLSTEELSSYILAKVAEFPELSNTASMAKYAKMYGFGKN